MNVILSMDTGNFYFTQKKIAELQQSKQIIVNAKHITLARAQSHVLDTHMWAKVYTYNKMATTLRATVSRTKVDESGLYKKIQGYCRI